MNWGLFLALAGWLLPFAHAMRQIVLLAAERGGAAVIAARWLVLALLAIPLSGKLPAVLYAATGRYGSLSQLTESFLVSGWGMMHLAATVVAVAAIDLLGGSVFARLSNGAAALPFRWDWRALGRDAGIAACLLLLAWVAAR